MTAQTSIGSTYVPLAFTYGTLAVANADGTLLANMTTSIKSNRMAKGGWVIGVGVNLDGTLTTGTLTFTPTLNDVPMTGAFANTVSINSLGTSQTVVAQQPAYRFNANDTVGLMYNKTGTIAPTTRNIHANLIVLLDSYDY